MPLYRLALAALAGACSIASNVRAENGPAALDGLFAEVARDGSPGCAVGVDRPGVPMVLRTYGLADLERPRPVAIDTVFEAGSVSKQFTAAAIAILAVDGVLSLDDDIRRWLPEMAGAGPAITVRMLLNHTSGLRNWDDLVELQGWPEGTRVYEPAYVLDLVARQRAPNFTPGTQYLYSNTNYVLAAAIVARASGASFAAFSRTRLFEPLGMKSTRWRDDYAAVVPGRAIAYSRNAEGAWRQDMPFGDVVGPGGLLTTVPDLLRWNQALSRPSAANAPWVDLLTRRGRLSDGTVTAYGLGLEFSKAGGADVISHAGATAGYRAYLSRAPAQGLSVAILCNAGSLNTEDLGPEVDAAFLASDAATPPPAPAPANAAAVAQAAAAAGGYRNLMTDALVTATARDGDLAFDGGPPFRALGQGLFRNRGGTREVLALDGARRLRITRVGNSPIELERVKPWRPTAETLAAYQGRYRSEEVDADMVVQAEGDGLVALLPNRTRYVFSPLYADAFEAPEVSWRIVFQRNGGGRITGLTATSTRTRRVRYARSP